MKLGSWLCPIVASKLSPFLDDIHYEIKWAGEEVDFDELGHKYEEKDFVIMKTANQEEYKCFFPSDETVSLDEKSSEETGESAETLLAPLFKETTKKDCSLRIETYWSYELCHGQFIRQFHEEKVKGSVKSTEYYLGRLEENPLNPANAAKNRAEVSKKKLDGLPTPYHSILMGDGTECDIHTGKKRKTDVRYICNPNAIKPEIMSITETTTCEYEILVLTNLLCSSPLYSLHLDTETFGIPCQKIGDSPTVPIGYTKPMSDAEGIVQTIIKHAQEMGVNVNDIQIDGLDAKDNTAKEIKKKLSEHTRSQINAKMPSQKVQEAKKAQLSAETEKILNDFLAGDFCLRGGQGWWRYEFCYGKHVKQYHEFQKEQGKPKEPTKEIIVGKWDEVVHLDWAKNRQNVKHSKEQVKTGKQVKAGKTIHGDDGFPISVWDSEDQIDEVKEVNGEVQEVELWYSGGEICDITKKPREVLVRLKCKPNQDALSLYLLEPKTCSYILVLESKLLCSILKNADENGLLSLK